MPLLMHGVMVTLGFIILRKIDMLKHKWLSHLIYWFIIANLMELIAYIVMRPFAPNGDTGHFNRGLNISPWCLFIIGTVLLVYVIYIILSKLIPDLYKLFAASNILIEWSILVLSAFIVFLWDSGLRVIFYIHPDPQWKFGIIGIIAFLIIPIVYRPAKRCRDLM